MNEIIFNSRSSKYVTSAYTLVPTIDTVNASGTFAVTLYDIDTTLRGTVGGGHIINNTGTGVITLTAATNDTVNGYSSIILRANESVHIQADKRRQRWDVGAPQEIPVDVSTVPTTIAVDTNGTTAVNVFGPAGAPRDLTITDIFVTALDTTAGNIVIKNGTDTVATIAKGTTDTAMVGQTALANTVVAQGAVCTVESSTAGNANVKICYAPSVGDGLPS
jgi:hypothetical protein